MHVPPIGVPLILALGDKESRVRSAAAESLGLFGDKKAIESPNLVPR